MTEYSRGLYPRKGAIAPGSDADIVLIDPKIRKTLTLGDLHAELDYSIWEGFECHGYRVTTILRGKIMVEDGSPYDGQWLPRKIAPEILLHPAV